MNKRSVIQKYAVSAIAEISGFHWETVKRIHSGVIDDFRKFFEEFDMEQLSNVNTFAMDMNASFNRPVEKYMPKNRDCL